MKGGGSRLNVNTDKPHSLISIKNKVLPTSPPARQSPQATPTAARSWRPGEREPGEPLAAPRRLPGPRFPPARPPPTPRGPPTGRPRRGAPGRDTSRHAPRARPPEPAGPARADPAPPHTLLRAHAAGASRQPRSPWTRRRRPGWGGGGTDTAASWLPSPRASLAGHRGHPHLPPTPPNRFPPQPRRSRTRGRSTRPHHHHHLRARSPPATQPFEPGKERFLHLAACSRSACPGRGLLGPYLSLLPWPAAPRTLGSPSGRKSTRLGKSLVNNHRS